MYKKLTALFETKDRVFGLDLLRFVAILLVIQGHTRWMTNSFPKPLKALLHGSGILGVELFFVLSGFLIGGILLKQFEKNNYSLDFAAIKHFWVRRWFRTLPNYYFILIVYIIVYYAESPDRLWRYFLFLQNAWNSPAYFFEESWSLCIEEISYLVSPLILGLSAVLFGKKGKGNQAYFLWVSIALIALVSALRYIYTTYYLLPDYKWNIDVREVAIIRLDAIYYGFIAVYINRRFPLFWNQFKIVLFAIGLLGILGLMGLQKSIVEQFPGFISNNLFFTFLSISIACLLPYLSSVQSIKWNGIAKPITAISIISYSMYLINGGLLSFSLMQYTNEGANWTAPFAMLMYGLFWVICIGLSALIFLFFEKPMTDLRNRF